ncbi:hypothetical protein BDW62DRAFT_202944 [Aspergillus aurantiobrunneus]
MSTVLTQAADGRVHGRRCDLPSAADDEVLIRFIASPINPLDLLVLAGKYPVRPKHQHNGEPIVGYDGVGEVIACGAHVSHLVPGDYVVPSQFGVGTWRTHAAIKASLLQKIARPKDPVFASLLRMAVSPAYFLVEEIRDLKPGECIIQNAGTSAVAQYVTQFANRRGVSVIHVIRDRDAERADAIEQALRASGAAEVLTESELAKQAAVLKQTRRIVLALDSVYGASGSALLAALSDEGTYVHIGFLGGTEGTLQLNPQDLFGRRLTLRGFRGSAHLAARSAAEQCSLFNWWISLFNQGELRLPVLGLTLVDWRTHAGDGGQVAVDALERAQGKLGQRKQILMLRHDLG